MGRLKPGGSPQQLKARLTYSRKSLGGLRALDWEKTSTGISAEGPGWRTHGRQGPSLLASANGAAALRADGRSRTRADPLPAQQSPV